jgi:hypothetical protein
MAYGKIKNYFNCYYCSFSTDTDLEDLYLYLHKPIKGLNLKNRQIRSKAALLSALSYLADRMCSNR